MSLLPPPLRAAVAATTAAPLLSEQAQREQYARTSVSQDIDDKCEAFHEHAQQLLRSLRAEQGTGATGRGGSERQLAEAEHVRLSGNGASINTRTRRAQLTTLSLSLSLTLSLSLSICVYVIHSYECRIYRYLIEYVCGSRVVIGGAVETHAVAVEGLEDVTGRLLDTVELLKRSVLVSGDAEHAGRVCAREFELRHTERECLRRMLDVTEEMADLHARMERAYAASGRDLVSSSSTDVEMEDKNTAQESKRQRRSVANEKDGAEKQQRAVDKLLRMVLNDMST